MADVVSTGIPDSAQGSGHWIHTAGFWLFTLVISYEMMAGGIWDLLRIEYVRRVLTHLGYPLYLLSILGFWKIPCALVMLLPRFRRLKEWAYAGALFDYTGAAASLFLVGDGASQWAVPLVFAGFTLASWALRPPTRRLAPANPASDVSTVEWIVPIVIIVVLLALALAWFPKGSNLG